MFVPLKPANSKSHYWVHHQKVRLLNTPLLSPSVWNDSKQLVADAWAVIVHKVTFYVLQRHNSHRPAIKILISTKSGNYITAFNT